MGATPSLKVYRGREYLAAFKYAEDAAALVVFLADPRSTQHRSEAVTIRGSDHKTVLWTEGFEDQPAAESYDHVAAVVATRSKGRYA